MDSSITSPAKDCVDGKDKNDKKLNTVTDENDITCDEPV